MRLGEMREHREWAFRVEGLLGAAEAKLGGAIAALEASSELTSAAYDAAAVYFRAGHREAARLLGQAAEKLRKAIDQFVEDYLQEVSTVDQDQNKLMAGHVAHKRMAQEQEDLIAQARAALGGSTSLPQMAQQAELHRQCARDLIRIYQSMDSHGNRWEKLPYEIDLLLSHAEELIKALGENGLRPAGSPVTLASLGSSAVMDHLWPYQIVMVEFGLDRAAAESLVKLESGIGREFPDMEASEQAYLFAMVVSKFTYNDDKWAHTNGSLGEYFKKKLPSGKMDPCDLQDVCSRLGVSGDAFQHLENALKNQHSGALAKGQPDLVHLMATCATELDPKDIRLAEAAGDRRMNAGWRGDALGVLEGGPSMGNDDYKADLDAVNIARAVKLDGAGFLITAREYYSGITDGSFTRADRFLERYPLYMVTDELTNGYSPLVPKNDVAGKLWRSLEAGSNDLLE
jgi:hypothetical protein